MHYCDSLLHLSTSDGNNTVMSAAIASAGADGLASTPTTNFIGNPAFTGMAVSDDFASQLPDAYYVRADNFWLPTNNLRSFRFDNTGSGRSMDWDFSSLNKQKAMVYGLIKLNVVNDALSAGLYDMVRWSSQAAGAPAVIQLDVRTNQAGYALNIETPNGNTKHSAYVTVTPGNAYWCCLYVDFSKKTTDLTTCKLAIYDYPSLTLLDASLATDALGGADVAPDTCSTLELGNSEAGVSTGFNYFKGWAVDFNDMTFPVAPLESRVKFPNRSGRPAPFKPGIGR